MTKIYYIQRFFLILLCLFFASSESVLGSSSSSAAVADADEDIWILSLSGGGVRGLMEVAFLNKLEEKTGLSIAKIFKNGIGATSTGSLVSLGLTASNEDGTPKFTCQDVMAFYRQKSPQIFKKKKFAQSCSDLVTAMKKGLAFTGPMYEANNLKIVLKDLVKDQPMGDLAARVFITAYDSENSQNILLDSQNPLHRSLPSRKAAQASRAAPTCFRPCSLKIPAEEGQEPVKRSLMDGGLYAIDPAKVTYEHMRKIYPDKRIRVVSLQTGLKANGLKHQDAQMMGSIGFAPWFIETLLRTQKQQVHEDLSEILSPDDYYYFDIALDPGYGGLDDTRVEHLDYLQALGENMALLDPQFTKLVAAIKPAV